METIYSNSIEFGRFYAYLMFFVALIVAIVMIWWSWSIHDQNVRFKGVTKGSVTEAACEAINNDTLSCAVDAVYSVDGRELSVSNFNVKTPVPLKAGDKVKLNYNMANPSHVISSSDLIPSSWSTSLVWAALLIVIFATFKMWMVRKYNFAAAGSAIYGVAGTLGR